MAQSAATEDIWAQQQPGAQLGASRWETANLSLNPPFLLRSPVPNCEIVINDALSSDPLIPE